MAGEPAGDAGRLRVCAPCEADLASLRRLEAVEPDHVPTQPTFLGAVGMRERLPNWPTEVALVGLDVWDGFIELRHIERPGDSPREPHPRMVATSGPLKLQSPRKFELRTDVGTLHHGHSGGGGTRGTDTIVCGEAVLAPALPHDAAQVVVVAQAPGSRTELAIELTGWPAPISDARVDIDDPVPDTGCRCCGGPYVPPGAAPATGLALDWTMTPPPEPLPRPPRDPRPMCMACRDARRSICLAKQPATALPDAVVALNTRLAGAVGADLVIPTISCWTTWFDLDITGPLDGPWSASLTNLDKAWTIHDDRGNRYVGACLGGASRYGLATHNLSFIPALDPTASHLTVTFPPSIDGTTTRATINLPALDRPLL